jgi:non-ribosomal peptide synthetase component F
MVGATGRDQAQAQPQRAQGPLRHSRAIATPSRPVRFAPPEGDGRLLLTGAQAEHFAAWACVERGTLRLRPYQIRAGQRLLGLMAAVPGETVGLVMPRQSGKDE